MGNIEQSARQIGLESMMAQMLEKEKDAVAQSVPWNSSVVASLTVP